MSEVPLYWQRSHHACTPSEALSEQDLEEGHVHSTRYVPREEHWSKWRQWWCTGVPHF